MPRFLVLFACLAVVGCATSPTGRSQLILLDQGQMAQLGSQSFSKLKSEMEIERSPRINRYVGCVVDHIAREVDMRRYGNINWEVVVFRDESANAFALPGGKIGVHTGLLDVAENQSQLATVIGHEIAHVLARHGAERLSQSQVAGLGMIAAGTAVGMADVGDDTASSIMLALGIGAQFGVLLPYSRTHETEADIYGLQLMAQAGFDPLESVTLWQNMARANPGSPPEFLSTHPHPSSRISNLQTRMGQARDISRRAQAAGKNPRCA